MQMNIRILLSQLRDVRFKPFAVEPGEHLVKLLTENNPHEGERDPLKLYRLAENTTEHFCRLDVSQLTSGNLQLDSNELAGTLEGQGHKSPDILRCNCLIGLVTSDRIG